MVVKLVEGVSFLGGFEADEPRTSEFFKLQKIRTLEKDIPRKNFTIDDFKNKKNGFRRK
jgi:hypothetical protein